MGRCSYCGDNVDHPFPCRHCDNSYCAEHRLPENHECPLFITDTEFGGSGPDTRPVRDDRATSKQRIYQNRTSRSQEKGDDSPGSENRVQSDDKSTITDQESSDAFCEGCGKIYYPDGLCEDCRDEPDETDQSDGNTWARGPDTEPGIDESHTTKKNASSAPDEELESSPDVAPDGSIVHNDKTESTDSEESSGGLFKSLSGKLQSVGFPFISSDSSSDDSLSTRYHGDYSHRRSSRSSPSFRSRLFTRLKTWFYRIVIISLIAAIVILGIALTVGTGVQAIDNTVDDLSSAAAGVLEEEPLNRTQIEREIHVAINEERRESGLQTLSYDTVLRDIARYHSEDMANRSYYAHESLEGDNFEDRYRQFGYDCRVPTGENMYFSGAENIAYTYADQDVQTERGVEDYDRNETKIARAFVEGWMNSPGHRRNILEPAWRAEGLGVAITEDDDGTKVLATQNFC